MNDDLVWVDIETFGLNPTTDPIIEVGIKITDLELNTLGEKSWLIWSGIHQMALGNLQQRTDEGAKIVSEMHTKSNLFNDAMDHGKLINTVSDSIVKWLDKNDAGGAPMCGSSIQFDRNFLTHQMPRVEKLFHYRNIDVSTLKELCSRYNPRVYEMRPDLPQPHRALPDLVNSIAEFKFYRDEFLLW